MGPTFKWTHTTNLYHSINYCVNIYYTNYLSNIKINSILYIYIFISSNNPYSNKNSCGFLQKKIPKMIEEERKAQSDYPIKKSRYDCIELDRARICIKRACQTTKYNFNI